MLLHLLQRGQYISYIIMYYRSPCLFFRNTVRSASSCFRIRQDHYGARGLWPDHARARGLLPDHARSRGLWPDHAHARGLTRPLRARGLRRSLLDLCSGTASTTLRPRLGDFASRLHATGDSHTVGVFFFSLRPCYKAHTSPSSKLGDYIGTMHLPVHLVSLVRRFVSQLN